MAPSNKNILTLFKNNKKEKWKMKKNYLLKLNNLLANYCNFTYNNSIIINKYSNIFTFIFKTVPPKPHPFVTTVMTSNLDISQVVSEINNLLPQLTDFINQFNNLINQTGIQVVSDSMGSMSIDVPANMSDAEVHNISQRIGVIDRLINTRGEEINKLLQEGLRLENKLKTENPHYVSQLTNKIEEFKRLNASYNH